MREDTLAGHCFDVYLAHHCDNRRETVRSLLAELGHSVSVCTSKGQILISAAVARPADVMVVSRELADMAGIDALLKIAEIKPRPSVIVTDNCDLESLEDAMKDHVMSYLIEPVTQDDLRPALYLAQRRFNFLESLKQQAADLETTMEERKIIERAKGVMMKADSIDEPTAHRRLQSMARSQRSKLVSVARSVLAGSTGGVAPPPTTGSKPGRPEHPK